jgi:hypothetical protein
VPRRLFSRSVLLLVLSRSAGAWRWLARALNALPPAEGPQGLTLPPTILEQLAPIVAFLEARFV